MSTQPASIVHQITFSKPPARVWAAIAQRESLARWLMENDFEPRVGHEFTFRSEPVPPYWDGVVHCKVTELDPPNRLTYTWRGGPGLETQVTYVLEPIGEGTRLHFIHSGFDLALPGQQMAFDSMKSGWTGADMEDRLRAVVEAS